MKELNCLGERKKSFGEYISEDFQRRYASAVVELSQLNRDLNEHLENIAEFTQQVSFDDNCLAMSSTYLMGTIIGYEQAAVGYTAPSLI